MKPRVAVGGTLSEANAQLFHRHFDRAELSDADGALGLCPTASELDAARGLRAIATVSAGFDNYDVADLTRRGILLMNCPGALTETTADLAFTLLMAAARRATELDAMVRRGGWRGGIGPELFGVDVHGRTLGIVGMGRIGQAIARRGALGFRMPVLYTSRSAKPEVEAALGAERCALDDLLRRSDFVVLAAPLSSETEGLIGARELDLLPRTAILVNIARGRIVDEDALISALEEGRLRAAGLDVYRDEPLPANSRLFSLPNTVLLPHIGSATHATREAMARESIENLVSFLGRGEAANPVNLTALEHE